MPSRSGPDPPCRRLVHERPVPPGRVRRRKTLEAYFVTCDKTTTTPSDINLGIVNVIVGFAPLKPAEFVVLIVKQIAGQVQV